MNKGDTGWTKSSASAKKKGGKYKLLYLISLRILDFPRDIWNGPDLIISLISDQYPAV